MTEQVLHLQQQPTGVLAPVVLAPPAELSIHPAEDSVKVRLNAVRAQLEIIGIDGATLVNYAQRTYLEWVHQPEYLILGEYDQVEGWINFVGVKASKRGNDVYAKRVRDRFKPLMELPDVHYFNYKDRSKIHQTGALFVTLTYDPKNITLGEAWADIGVHYNRFISHIRKKYGKVQVARVWESMLNGHPHIHAIMLFETKRFNAFHHNEAWRIQEKNDLADMWPHGFSDIEALCSTRSGFTYVSKYLGKLHELGHVPQRGAGSMSDINLEYGGEGSNLGKLLSRASVLTLSLMWINRKRAFSLSGGLNDLIRDLHNSNPDTPGVVLLQVDLGGGAPPVGIKQWVLCGFFIGELIKGGKLRWSVNLTQGEYHKIRCSGSYSGRAESAFGWCDLECAPVPRDIGYR